MAIYQSTNIVNGRADGSKGRILMTGNSGNPHNKVDRFIYPGPQGRGIRRESVILKNGWQTTAKNPGTLISTGINKKPRT